MTNFAIHAGSTMNVVGAASLYRIATATPTTVVGPYVTTTAVNNTADTVVSATATADAKKRRVVSRTATATAGDAEPIARVRALMEQE